MCLCLSLNYILGLAFMGTFCMFICLQMCVIRLADSSSGADFEELLVGFQFLLLVILIAGRWGLFPGNYSQLVGVCVYAALL